MVTKNDPLTRSSSTTLNSRSASVTQFTTPSSSSPISSDLRTILSDLQSNNDAHDNRNRPAKRAKNIVMTPDQFSQLLETFSNSCSSQSTVHSLESPTSTAQSTNAVMHYVLIDGCRAVVVCGVEVHGEWRGPAVAYMRRRRDNRLRINNRWLEKK
jgi:hypothetical protein